MTISILAQQIQRVTLQYSDAEKTRVYRYCETHDLRIVRHGPKLTEDLKIVPDLFECVAEKVISQGEG